MDILSIPPFNWRIFLPALMPIRPLWWRTRNGCNGYRLSWCEQSRYSAP